MRHPMGAAYLVRLDLAFVRPPLWGDDAVDFVAPQNGETGQVRPQVACASDRF